MDRRCFIKASALAGVSFMLDWEKAFALGKSDKAVSKPWKGWKQGHFQVHSIYTGVAESMFMIFPDGTSMLIDFLPLKGTRENGSRVMWNGSTRIDTKSIT